MTCRFMWVGAAALGLWGPAVVLGQIQGNVPANQQQLPRPRQQIQQQRPLQVQPIVPQQQQQPPQIQKKLPQGNPPQQPRVTAEDILRLIPQFIPQEGSVDPGFDPRWRNGYSRVPQYVPDVPPAPRLPSRNELIRASDDQLAAAIREAAAQLAGELSQVQNGPTWATYLDLAALSRLGQRQTSDGGEARRELLKTVVGRMGKIDGEDRYRTIWDRESFQLARLLLAQYIRPNNERAGEALAGDVERLAGALDRVATGPQWKNHLGLAELSRAGQQPEQLQRADREQLAALARRFDEVATSDQYRSVANMRGFAGTRASLTRLNASLAADAAGRVGLNPQPEPPSKSAAGTVKLNPQPEPPSKSAAGTVKLNPQPEPPSKSAAGTVKLNPQPEPPSKSAAGTVKLNPQPEPPGRSSDPLGKVRLNPQPEPPSAEDVLRRLAAAHLPEGADEAMVVKAVQSARAGDTEQLQQTWKQIVEALNEQRRAENAERAALYVVAQVKALQDAELSEANNRLQYFDKLGEEVAAQQGHLAKVAGALGREGAARVEVLDKLPEYQPGDRPFIILKQKTVSPDELREKIKEVEAAAEKVRQQRQLASSHLQDAQQKANQQQALLANILKTLHETSQEVIRKAGG